MPVATRHGDTTIVPDIASCQGMMVLEAFALAAPRLLLRMRSPMPHVLLSYDYPACFLRIVNGQWRGIVFFFFFQSFFVEVKPTDAPHEPSCEHPWPCCGRPLCFNEKQQVRGCTRWSSGWAVFGKSRPQGGPLKLGTCSAMIRRSQVALRC